MKIAPVTNGHGMFLLMFAITMIAASLTVTACMSSKVKTTGETTPGYWPTAGWKTSTPEEQGFDSEKLCRALLVAQEKGMKIHSLLLIRNGRVFLDSYFYPYERGIYHDVASVTKSFMTTLIGIASDNGLIDVNRPILSYFPERTVANRDARKERITVGHLASCSSGLETDIADDRGTFAKMSASSDWVQHVLDQKVVFEPGSKFLYYSPGMYLLSALLTKVTGRSAFEFAKENLFEPLGIGDAAWMTDSEGRNNGGGDLSLYPKDAAKLAYLWLAGGRWEGRQIVSREWVEKSVRPLYGETGQVEHYGYGWWVGTEGWPRFMAAGRQGQRMEVIPSLDLIIVTTGGGFEWDSLSPYVAAAITNEGKPLPPNPDGVKMLEAALATVADKPAPQPVRALPAAAERISGRKWTFGENPSAIRSVELVFDGGPEAVMKLDRSSRETVPRVMKVGLDGVFRPSISGRPVFARGSWTDDTTFTVELDEGPGLEFYAFRAVVKGDRFIWSDPAGTATLEGIPEED